ncbi:MAG: HAD-IIIC family phosphatase [Lachnospiraceae bacterium]|nr:HAD-IIIC family phosphatase [Lachnospiraceae bacterium]
MSEITFTRLKRNCKKDMSDKKKLRLAILGDCATQHLATAIRGYGVEEELWFEVFDADYNQIDAQLLDPQSEFFQFDPQFALIYMCSEKLYHSFYETEDKAGFADAVYQKIRSYWELINSHGAVNIIQFTFVEADDRIFGNYAAKTQASFLYQVKKLNYLLMNGAQEVKNAFLMDLNYITAQYGREKVYDDKLYYIAKMPLSTGILPEVAKQVTDIVKAVSGRIIKCVVTDLDNTLWGGVIGDDGLEGIQIGELGLGHAFEEFQMWLKGLKSRGIILAVCSKNNEDTAKEPFLKHPEMVLRMDDFSMFVANWEDKASNIRYIQETLNIGMDSIVFLDDNAFERNQVKSMIPDITVPELPEDPAMYLSYLKGLNLFETASWSEADKDRTKQYQSEIKRTEQRRQYQNYDEYLQSLGMVAVAKPFDPFQYPRIAQLTQRSNQFNLRTVRYTEAEIEKLAEDDHFLTLYFMLKDQFGDHGLISVAILEKQDEETLFMHNWLMSCRVLKRGMEEFIINKVMETARENGYKRVIGEYIQTPKNAMVKDIYGKLGFREAGGGLFVADVDTFVQNKTFIKTEE